MNREKKEERGKLRQKYIDTGYADESSQRILKVLIRGKSRMRKAITEHDVRVRTQKGII